MKKFLKASEVELINGGYVSDKDGTPWTNEAFITAQKSAEYIVKFAELAKGKNFKSTKVDSLSDLRNEVEKSLEDTKVSFVTVKKPSAGELTTKLKKEALDFINAVEGSDKTEKINNFLQSFTILKDFEDHGLFFEQGVVKLNKIYTLEEIIKAVTETIDLL